jgi:hypothetical protein
MSGDGRVRPSPPINALHCPVPPVDGQKCPMPPIYARICVYMAASAIAASRGSPSSSGTGSSTCCSPKMTADQRNALQPRSSGLSYEAAPTVQSARDLRRVPCPLAAGRYGHNWASTVPPQYGCPYMSIDGRIWEYMFVYGQDWAYADSFGR